MPIVHYVTPDMRAPCGISGRRRMVLDSKDYQANKTALGTTDRVAVTCDLCRRILEDGERARPVGVKLVLQPEWVVFEQDTGKTLWRYAFDADSEDQKQKAYRIAKRHAERLQRGRERNVG